MFHFLVSITLYFEGLNSNLNCFDQPEVRFKESLAGKKLQEGLKDLYVGSRQYAPTQIKDELDYVYGVSLPSFTTVKIWAAEFKRGLMSLRDDERSGRPNPATTGGNISEVQQMVLDDHGIKVREIAEVMNMSKERVCHVLNQHLGMRKLSTRWVPLLLSLDQKRIRMNISNALLVPFRRNKYEFWQRLITADET
ncbi:histone-lysine N-methyltransferase SETMAR [Trichonephila clavipes]|nr:histone-lysine N-methyltransferase SETMAR [Trichonephila clavipes]